MQFSTIYSRVESLSNVTSQRALIKDAIQIGLYRATAQDLPYLMTDGIITTVALYETGTVTATNNSTTVTGSGTTFTAAMVGRKIRMGGDTAYYEIATFVSVTEITITAVYIGTTGGSKTFSIYKDQYRLPADMDVYKVLRQIENASFLVDVERTAFDMVEPSPRSAGDPGYSILAGTKLDTYTTGTVSITVNLSVLTGVGTSWLSVEGLGRGSKVTIGVYTYTVESVDSDTQITIYELASVTATGSTYSISLDNYIIQFHPYPDAITNIYFKYQRIPYPLINDQDIPELPDQWHHILITAGLIWAWEVKDKEESKRYELMFAQQVSEMWSRIGYISNAKRRPRQSLDEIEYWRRYSSINLPAGYGYPISYR